MDAANGVGFIDVRAPPRCPDIRTACHQSDGESRGVTEPQRLLSEVRRLIRERDARATQAPAPERERPGGHRERGDGDLPGAVRADAHAHLLVWERGHDRSRRARLVPVIEVVHVVVVEIHRLLDEPLAQDPGIEVEVRLGFGDRGGDVVEAADRLVHQALSDKGRCSEGTVPRCSALSGSVRLPRSEATGRHCWSAGGAGTRSALPGAMKATATPPPGQQGHRHTQEGGPPGELRWCLRVSTLSLTAPRRQSGLRAGRTSESCPSPSWAAPRRR